MANFSALASWRRWRFTIFVQTRLSVERAPDFCGKSFEFGEIRPDTAVQRELQSVGAGEDVKMHMRDALSRGRTIQLNEHHAGRQQRLLDSFRDELCRNHQAGCGLRREFKYRLRRFLGNDERVPFRRG